MVTDVFIHESSYVDSDVTIENGTKNWHFSHILSHSCIGPNCNIGQNVVIGPDVTIGAGCKIQNNVSIYKGGTLEDHVFCGPSMVFTNVFNPRANINRMHEARPKLIRYGASLGANCTIVCGITVGRFALVGAGTVVTKNVPGHALIYGTPGIFRDWVCECGEKLDKILVCPSCSLSYQKNDNGLTRLV